MNDASPDRANEFQLSISMWMPANCADAGLHLGVVSAEDAAAPVCARAQACRSFQNTATCVTQRDEPPVRADYSPAGQKGVRGHGRRLTFHAGANESRANHCIATHEFSHADCL